MSSSISTGSSLKGPASVEIWTSIASAPFPMRNWPEATCFHWLNVIRAVPKDLGLVELDFVGHSEAASFISGEDERADQFCQLLHVVDRANIERQCVDTVAELHLEHLGASGCARALQFTGDAWHRMAERVQHAANVTLTAKGSGRVHLRPRIYQGHGAYPPQPNTCRRRCGCDARCCDRP